jgi:hypothetical protein
MMDKQLTPEEWVTLKQDGFLRLVGAFKSLLPSLQSATGALTQQYPYGFADPRYYTGTIAQPLTLATARPDGRILLPYVGFMNFDILAPLRNPHLHETLEQIVGKDFYLSNTWYQEVPPGVERLAYHKDTRGSITFNILLDDISPGMGSTCLIPGSHINTPPASYCMDDPRVPHPAEVDLIGDAGDLVLFSAETWHGRSKHVGKYRTRRLFYNFYSRSSRATTTWAGIVDAETLERARATLPREYGHMFDINPRRTKRLATINGSPVRSWAYRSSSSDDIIRDVFYSAFTYGRPTDNANEPGSLMPFTTRLSEARAFSATEYFSKVRLIPTLKNVYHYARKKLGDGVRKIARIALPR